MAIEKPAAENKAKKTVKKTAPVLCKSAKDVQAALLSTVDYLAKNQHDHSNVVALKGVRRAQQFTK